MEDSQKVNTADKCFARLSCSPHTVLPLRRIRVRFVPLLLYEHFVLLNRVAKADKVLTARASYLTRFFTRALDVWFAATYWSYHTRGNTNRYTHAPSRSSSGGLDVTGSCHSPTLMQTACITHVRLSKHTLTLLLLLLWGCMSLHPLFLRHIHTHLIFFPVSIVKRWLFPKHNVL